MSNLKRPGKDDGLTIISTWPGEDEEVSAENSEEAAPATGEPEVPESDAEKDQAGEESSKPGEWTLPSDREGWSPDEGEVDDGVEDQLALLGPVIRQAWLAVACGALGSFGLVVWALGQESALLLQGLLLLDCIALLAFGLGLYSYRIGFGYMLLGWALVGTVMALLIGGPIAGQTVQLGWVLWRASLMLAFLRGITAVTRWNKLVPAGAETIPWRFDYALSALASPPFIVFFVATVLSVGLSFTLKSPT